MASRSEFAASVKAKYPQYAAVDDSVLVDKILAKYPQYAIKITDSAAPIAPKPEISMSEALFPRRSKASKEGAGFPRKQFATLADIGGDVFGVPYAATKKAFGEGGFKETLAKKGGDSFIGKMATDPAAASALIPGATIPRLLMQGGASALMHQADNVGEGRNANPKAAAAEIGLSALLPKSVEAGGKGLMGIGKGIVQSVTKRSGLSNAAQKTLSTKEAGNFLENFGSLRGLKKSDEKLEARHDVLSQKFDDLINNAAAGKHFDLFGALNKAENELMDLEKSGGINLDEAETMRKSLSKWKDNASFLVDPQTGLIDFKKAQNFKKNTLDELARYSKIPKEMQFPEMPGKAAAARLARRNVSEEMGNIVPELKTLNKQYSEVSRLEPFVKESLERQSRNRFLSPQDLATLGLGGLGLGGSLAASDHPEFGMAAMLPFILSRGQKSTGVATGLYRAGKTISNPGIAGKIRKAALQRALSTGAFREGD